MTKKSEVPYEFYETKLDNLINGEKIDSNVWRFIRYSESKDTCIFMKRMREK
jgi:hypothetical protein